MSERTVVLKERIRELEAMPPCPPFPLAPQLARQVIMRRTLDQVITEMQAIANLNDEPVIHEMIQNVVAMCASALKGELHPNAQNPFLSPPPDKT